jgi:hypothetical protein
MRGSTLKDELVTAEIEPRLKQFRINLRFLRGKYTRPTFGELTGHQYRWDYFPEATVIIKFYETPPDFYPSGSAEGRKQQVVKEMEMTYARNNNFKVSAEKDINIGPERANDYEISFGGGKLRQRVFVHRGVWYSLLAEPKTPEADLLIDKLFNSFEFVDDSK